jgi:hypothetical protein
MVAVDQHVYERDLAVDVRLQTMLHILGITIFAERVSKKLRGKHLSARNECLP